MRIILSASIYRFILNPILRASGFYSDYGKKRIIRRLSRKLNLWYVCYVCESEEKCKRILNDLRLTFPEHLS